MIKQLNLTQEQQIQAIEYLWYLLQMIETMALKKKYKSLRNHVIEGYDFLNKINYTKSRPSWEVKEDPRQMKLFKE